MFERAATAVVDCACPGCGCVRPVVADARPGVPDAVRNAALEGPCDGCRAKAAEAAGIPPNGMPRRFTVVCEWEPGAAGEPGRYVATADAIGVRAFGSSPAAALANAAYAYRRKHPNHACKPGVRVKRKTGGR